MFKCPHCTFWASTASRFHVHIVGHLNKKPFECSYCAYRSNWRWDITKHIRLKSARDEMHQGAKVLMTDETGRRNYTKYNKYLTVMEVDDSCSKNAVGGDCDATVTGSRKSQQTGGRKRAPRNSGTVVNHGVVVDGKTAMPSVRASAAQQQTGQAKRFKANRNGVGGAAESSVAKPQQRKQQQQKEQQQQLSPLSQSAVTCNTSTSSVGSNASADNRKTVWKCKKCFFRYFPNFLTTLRKCLLNTRVRYPCTKSI